MLEDSKMFLCVSGIGMLLSPMIDKDSIITADAIQVTYKQDGTGVTLIKGPINVTLPLDAVDHLLQTEPEIHFYDFDIDALIQPFFGTAVIDRDSLLEAKGACRALGQY